ncbi:MAG TPA: hypothetical protein VGB82_18955 [Alphaproteobacteria bacterium]
MISYRCYFCDGANHILKVETADHASDPEAIAWAATLHRDAPQYTMVEVWQGARLIDRKHPSSIAN